MKKLLFIINIVLLVLIMCSCSHVDYGIYEGTWASEDIGWLNGGYILDLMINDDEMDISCSNTQGTPMSRVAEINETIKLSDIKDYVAQIEYEDDGWGNSGKITITFSESTIVCNFKNIVADELANWGFSETEVTFVKDDEAHQKMEYTLEEYEAIYPPEPTYDMSKASGILASMGMTEEQFRVNCQPLSGQNANITIHDLHDYPSNYIGNHFILGTGNFFECTFEGISNDGYNYYEDHDFSGRKVIIYDFRDDIYSPNISQGDLFTPYAIFKEIRTYNGNDYLVFWMISLDT